MRKTTTLVVIFAFAALASIVQAGQEEGAVPVKVTLKANQEIKVSIDNTKLQRIKMTVLNQLDEVSTFWWTSFFQGKERDDAKIGPRKYRTHELQPKITEEGKVRRPDKKVMVLVVENTDAVLIHVDKGEILVEVIEDKKPSL